MIAAMPIDPWMPAAAVGGCAGDRDVPSCCVASKDYANKYYDGILQADALIERIFQILGAKRLLEDAVIAITADHRELLGESGQVGHGGQPVDPVVRVPLLIYDSDRFAYPARPLACVIDIAPTLLDRIGAHIPEHWSGIPLSRATPRRFAELRSELEHRVPGLRHERRAPSARADLEGGAEAPARLPSASLSARAGTARAG